MIPLVHHDSRVRENSEVVMKFTHLIQQMEATDLTSKGMQWHFLGEC